MVNKITESEIEEFAIELLGKSGYQYVFAPSIAPDLSACDVQSGSNTPEGASFEDVLLIERLQTSIGSDRGDSVIEVN